MEPKKKAVFNWSGGKDSSLALYKALQTEEYEIVSLLTTINSENRRSSMHAIPVSLLQRQAESIGIPLVTIDLAPSWGMSEYENAMRTAVEHFRGAGVTHFIFGDIFLHDVRTYRETQLKPYGIKVVEPLWDRTTEEVMNEFLVSGLKTIVVTIMADRLDRSFIGREVDSSFVADLPAGTDICGENGEYHTFCHSGGMFRYPVAFALGEPEQHAYTVRLDDGTEQEYRYWFAHLQE